MADEQLALSGRYLYERVGPARFQQLCGALLKHSNPDVTCYPIGESDGGRDVTLDRLGIIYQVKWAKRQPRNPVVWLNRAIAGEAKNIRALVAAGAREYVLMTTVSGTSAPGSGSMDSLNKELEAHSQRFGIPMRCEWRDCIDARVDAAPAELKVAYMDMLAGADAAWVGAHAGLIEQPVSPATDQLNRLTARVRDRTGHDITGPEGSFQIVREEVFDTLLSTLTDAGTGAGIALVVGEPDVGKSAMTLRIAETLRNQGNFVPAFSLYHLPPTLVELESSLGRGYSEALRHARTGAVALTVIDGAEAAQEGRFDLLTQLVVAALRADFGVAIVARSDAGVTIRDSVAQARRAVETATALVEYEFPALSEAERSQLTTKFTSLQRLMSESTAWVFGRLGLVDLLLRIGSAALPDRILSEADVFAAVWRGIVRRPTAPCPDAREHALVMMARRRLLPDTPMLSSLEVSALPSLRSDGLLLASDAQSAWNSGEEFSGDLLRDLATAKLLLIEGWAVLRAAGAPRWALRATRLACQARLSGASHDIAAESIRMNGVFRDLAMEFGYRWAELPLEALMTHGAAPQVHAEIWPTATEQYRDDLLRLAFHRHTRAGVGDPAVLAPLVEFAYVRPPLDSRKTHLRPDGAVERVVLAWLRGLVHHGTGRTPLRARVRDAALADAEQDSKRKYTFGAISPFLIEALSLLGSDLDSRTERFLRGCDGRSSSSLQPAVEHHWSISSLAQYNPKLLADLAILYYGNGGDHKDAGKLIERKAAPDPDLGPFAVLLETIPSVAFSTIQSILNRRAESSASRVGRSSRGIELEFPDGSRRYCHGNYLVWNWRWGGHPFSSMDMPAVSALSALERHVSSFLNAPGPSVAEIVELMLHDCTNLAMPALVVTLLIEHIDKVEDELDCWLTQPEVWELEWQSYSYCERLHAGTEVPEWRSQPQERYWLSSAAATLMAAALSAGSDEYIALLAGIGTELARRSQAIGGGVAERGRRWSMLFESANYHLQTQDGTVVGIDYQPPAEPEPIPDETCPDEAPVRRFHELEFKYDLKLRDDKVPTHTELAADLSAIRRLATIAPYDQDRSARRTAESISLAAITAFSAGATSLSEEDMQWAVAIFVEGCRSTGDEMERVGRYLSGNPDTGNGLLTLLAPRYDQLNISGDQLAGAFLHLATELLSGFGSALASGGASAVWAAPCRAFPQSGRCRHDIAWSAVETWLRYNAPGYGQQIDPHVGVRELLSTLERPNRHALVGPIVACAEASASTCCVNEEATTLFEPLLAVYRSCMVGESKRPMSHADPENSDKHIPRLLFDRAAKGDFDPLRRQLEAFAGSPAALSGLLYGLTWHATHHADARRALPSIWPSVMTLVLDNRQPEPNDRLEYLLPAPTTARLSAVHEFALAVMFQPDRRHPDEIVAEATAEWISPAAIDGLIERWIPFVAGQLDAMDRFVRFARTTAVAWQITAGLDHVERLLDGEYGGAGWSRALAVWLTDLRPAIEPQSSRMKVFLRIVDTMVERGNPEAMPLQLAAE